MGKRPSEKYSIERINNDGDYCKENCKWILKSEQSNNTRRSRKINYNEKIKCLTEWCKELNLPYGMLSYRLNNTSMAFEEAIYIPPHTKLNKWKKMN